jgi:hypothetical protein
MGISLFGESGYRAPPGNHFIIDVSRSKNMRRRRQDLLNKRYYVLQCICMQMIAVITGESMIHYISANIADSCIIIRCPDPSFEGQR